MAVQDGFVCIPLVPIACYLCNFPFCIFLLSSIRTLTTSLWDKACLSSLSRCIFSYPLKMVILESQWVCSRWVVICSNVTPQEILAVQFFLFKKTDRNIVSPLFSHALNGQTGYGARKDLDMQYTKMCVGYALTGQLRKSCSPFLVLLKAENQIHICKLEHFRTLICIHENL